MALAGIVLGSLATLPATSGDADPPAGVAADRNVRIVPAPAPEPEPRNVRFRAAISTIGRETLALMGTSWRPGCPLPLEDLRVIAMNHWDFAGEVRQGKLIVHEKYAEAVAGVFRKLFEARFPIARMEPANGYMGNDPPLAQFNNTVGFNCRAPVGGGHRWSEHSYGTAVDINPDQNPYVSRSGRIEPPFGAPWADRSLREPGMIDADHLAVNAFRAIGWRWGGLWRGTKDYMHFSASGR